MPKKSRTTRASKPSSTPRKTTKRKTGVKTIGAKKTEHKIKDKDKPKKTGVRSYKTKYVLG